MSLIDKVKPIGSAFIEAIRSNPLVSNPISDTLQGGLQTRTQQFINAVKDPQAFLANQKSEFEAYTNQPLSQKIDAGVNMAIGATEPLKNVGKVKNAINPLLSEARKYKSAEEFVNSPRYEYHLSSEANLAEGKTFAEQATKATSRNRGFANAAEEGIYSTNSPQFWATQLESDLGKKAPQNVYLVEVKNPSPRGMLESGFDAQAMNAAQDVRVIKKLGTTKDLQDMGRIESLKKSQLTSIWNEANKGGQAFQGFKDLTTKFLDYSKGKTTLSKQEILDFAKRPELKRGEADLLNRLGNEVKGTKVSAQEFADSIRGELLELKPVKVKEPQFSGITIEAQQEGSTFFKPPKKNNYEEVVFESPITTNGSSHYPNSKNYFAHARGDEVVEKGKKIWREQEIQSDLLQKDNLEKLSDDFAKSYDTALEEAQSRGFKGKEAEKLAKEWVQEQDALPKLSPFTNDRFGERIMRERIREKASKGYEKYRLPTGETIGKIEGFEAPSWMIDSGTNRGKLLTKENLKVGDEVMSGDVIQNNNQWIITDILGDGRFKAVPKNIADGLKRESYWIDKGKDGWVYVMNETLRTPPKPMPSKAQAEAFIKSEIEKGYEHLAETFDLTGKSNPQYKRYENWGKFLKNKFGGKEVVDPQGNTWMEIDLKKEQGKMPIEAFAAAPIIPMLRNPYKEDKK